MKGRLKLEQGADKTVWIMCPRDGTQIDGADTVQYIVSNQATRQQKWFLECISAAASFVYGTFTWKSRSYRAQKCIRSTFVVGRDTRESLTAEHDEP